ncbi:hypothetical protein BDZ94DRAFT_1311695 [Collybia nuda]|uniref:Uncharacterized protein n=1 Tax=Collybia nuda TaxID=64659 RepID=A0A9P5Y2X3_9AGAR|nr:hypothetical protein BDZ94DRAFT_1311695 [Collybia nuda]
MSIASFGLYLGIVIPFPSFLGIFAQVLSFGANFVITCLIGHVYWVHRKDIKVLFDKANHRSKAGSILAILVTTGVVLSVTRMMYIIIDFYPAPSSYAFSVMRSIYFGFEHEKLQFIYPNLTIVLVNIENNFEQRSIINSSLPPIHFGNSQKSRVSTQDRPWVSAFAVPIEGDESVGDLERI